MFEAAELGNKISKTAFNHAVPDLRIRMLEVQQRLRHAGFPVIVYFGGVDGAGKSETVNVLNEWMDPRWTITRAYTDPSDEEQERPEYWRYWRDLPPRGVVGFFLSGWYSRPVLARVQDRITDAELDQELDRVMAFERSLAADGALIVKFWMHLGKKAQHDRFKSLEQDPLTSWRVTKTDWDHWRLYDSFASAAERTIMRTSIGRAPWHIVEGADPRYRSLTVATLLLDAIERRLAEREMAARVANGLDIARAGNGNDDADADADAVKKAKKGKKNKKAKKGNGATALADFGLAATPTVSVLSQLDMSQKYSRRDYPVDLEALQGRLNRLSRQARNKKLSTIAVFCGWDAGGKGGCIRRITAALDARNYQVIPIAAPTDEEQAHHYMWRFWRHLSRAGRVTIFDRSWYGRVLVERIEGFATDAEWMRAYAEINDFEEQLVDHGIVLVKYWLHITKDEQLRRFKRRKRIPYKRWKLTDEDWRNREKWDLYEMAVNDMIARTSTSIAPWTLIEGNDKRFARIKTLSTVCDALEKGLDRKAEPIPAATTPSNTARKQ